MADVRQRLGKSTIPPGTRAARNWQWQRGAPEAVERASAVVVVDGTTPTRNAFLEFVREFNECAERQRRHRPA